VRTIRSASEAEAIAALFPDYLPDELPADLGIAEDMGD
jgi:hypothetical protein